MYCRPTDRTITAVGHRLSWCPRQKRKLRKVQLTFWLLEFGDDYSNTNTVLDSMKIVSEEHRGEFAANFNPSRYYTYEAI